MAAVLMDELSRRSQNKNACVIASAGVNAWDGAPASRHAIAVMAQEGLCLQSHRSRQLTQVLVDEAQLVLTMTGGHKQIILSAYPASAGRVFTLCEYAGQSGDVHDPFGGDEAVYRDCANQIKDLLHTCSDRLREEIWRV